MYFDLHSMGVPMILYHLQTLKSTEMITINSDYYVNKKFLFMLHVTAAISFFIQHKYQ